jgi:hypothetical protein
MKRIARLPNLFLFQHHFRRPVVCLPTDRLLFAVQNAKSAGKHLDAELEETSLI